jgi:parallel beta-helix repeat protein
VLARNGARMDVYRSELSYLGYEANESYGVAWRLAGTSGEIIDSRFGYNFYGLYAYEASNLVIRGSEVHHSVRYGIDPHTRSNNWLIENNISHDNGKQGIILAEDCTGSVIRNNVVYGNALHGIVLYQRSNHNLVEGNTSYGNGLQGINVNASSHNTLRNNAVR